jgi:hypothetical protein
VEIAVHIGAVMAAALTAFASWRQARRALEKAEDVSAGSPSSAPQPSTGEPVKASIAKPKRLHFGRPSASH